MHSLTFIVEYKRVEGLATRLFADMLVNLLCSILIHHYGVAETLATTLNSELLLRVPHRISGESMEVIIN